VGWFQNRLFNAYYEVKFKKKLKTPDISYN
jgi:hypothetical protein